MEVEAATEAAAVSGERSENAKEGARRGGGEGAGDAGTAATTDADDIAGKVVAVGGEERGARAEAAPTRGRAHQRAGLEGHAL
ncbi:unnamed protein product, partial [Polarella glacialis]